MNQTAEHAIRALIYLARQPEGSAASAERVADALGAPANYLAKTMNVLAREGLLVGTRGPGGGYRLARPADQVRLSEVVEPFTDARPRTVCLLGDRPCSDATPCAAHGQWKRLCAEIAAPLARTTLADLLSSEVPESPSAGRMGGLRVFQGAPP